MEVPGEQDCTNGGGKQEAHRWRMRSYGRDRSINVIEPAEKGATAAPNTPFGFGRALSPHTAEDLPAHWEGQGL